MLTEVGITVRAILAWPFTEWRLYVTLAIIGVVTAFIRKRLTRPGQTQSRKWWSISLSFSTGEEESKEEGILRQGEGRPSCDRLDQPGDGAVSPGQTSDPESQRAQPSDSPDPQPGIRARDTEAVP